MTVGTAPTLDTEKFRKVHRLMTGGATDGERAAARARAEAMAAKAGMTLKQAVSSLDAKQVPPKPKGFFDGFEDWCEEREPGYKAKEAAKKAERNARDAARRAEVLRQYGSEEALFARTEREALLEEAITPLATWSYWTDNTGVRHRFVATLDGRKPNGSYWYFDDITPAIRDAVKGAYPWPSRLDAALKELKAWDRLRYDRCLFGGGEWEHHAEVECRFALLEHALKVGQPAASWDDVQARFDWKRYAFEREWIDPTERDDPFLDRLEADVAELRRQAVQEAAPAVPRTTAEKRAAVLSMLDAQSELSDREIARRVGVSPQTVGNLRRRAAR